MYSPVPGPLPENPFEILLCRRKPTIEYRFRFTGALPDNALIIHEKSEVAQFLRGHFARIERIAFSFDASAS
jgi:hypothetical protein